MTIYTFERDNGTTISICDEHRMEAIDGECPVCTPRTDNVVPLRREPFELLEVQVVG
ncbi:hypothetical protein IIB51_00865 [Patescibacteria group bacterium]|nr:hypothetical protein [Patescibacteria group bacterium]MCH8889258.1 hypothetical protein [Patescibacteria group bacterium]